MLLKVKSSLDIPASEITPEGVYRSRRDFIRTAAAGAVGVIAGSWLAGDDGGALRAQESLGQIRKSAYVLDTAIDARINSYDEITKYNNYYEFTTNKQRVWQTVGAFKPKPWTVKIDGLVNKPADYHLEDLIKPADIEERVYRHRCVEGWSMVMPWAGVPLADIIKRADPKSTAKFVEFTTVVRPAEMPGLPTGGLDWPYIEGLRLDEAMHPLTLVVVGLYGKELPVQDGAPIRIHIPWKYGFKSGKSIVRIRFTDKQPANSWAVHTPNEYGFYANVNPNVDHPRWSQKTERRIDGAAKGIEALRNQQRPTLMFNGYGDQVASLYTGMDLRKYLLTRVRALLDRILKSRLFKPAVFVAALTPAVWLVWDIGIWLGWWDSTHGGLGTDPTKEILHRTGIKALLFLFLSLSITPLRRVFSLNRLQTIRRMLGVWAFVYALLHVTTYLVLDRGCFSFATCDLGAVWTDITRRQFIWAGLVAFTVLLLLAATSTGWSVRLLKRWWQRLHRLAYLGAFAATIHYVWIQKSDIREPMRWMYVFTLLMLLRVVFAIRKWLGTRRRSRALV